MSEPTIRIKVEVDEQHLRESLADALRSIADDISPSESAEAGPSGIYIKSEDEKRLAEDLAARGLR